MLRLGPVLQNRNTPNQGRRHLITADHHVVKVESIMGKNALSGVRWCVLLHLVEEPGGIR